MVTTKTKRRIRKSDFAESVFWLNGAAFSLNDYPHMRTIYNSNHSEIVMQFSRQTSKSTTLANIIIANSAMIPQFKSMYVSPTVDQTKVFSHDRVAPVLEASPYMKSKYLNSQLVQNVFMKQLINGSKMYLRYALLNADRLRGYSTDMNVYDETQDLIADIIPISNQSMSRSTYKRTIFAGTPKRTRGTLADIYNNSTKNEWVVKCHHSGCKKWNELNEDNVGDGGTICKFCGKAINTAKNGQWAITGDPKATIQGFRVSILMFDQAPWVDWKKEVIDFRLKNPPAVFYNEVLGLPYDDGVSLVTEAEIRACCTGGDMRTTPTHQQAARHTYMGVDYGPINSNKSNTVMCIIQSSLEHNYPQIIYAKKYLGREADHNYIAEDIPRLKAKWQTKLIGADHGIGESLNAQIRKSIGYPYLIAYQHMANQADRIRYNTKLPAYTTNRTQVITEFARRIKERKIIFPKWEYFKPFAEDILNMAIEYSEDNAKMKIINTGPDDFAHTCIYGLLAYELDQQVTHFSD
tara:strand:+ start:53 stop:1615 length:1563 start_codon:yes stop_codon:yes gene_type:complete